MPQSGTFANIEQNGERFVAIILRKKTTLIEIFRIKNFDSDIFTEGNFYPAHLILRKTANITPLTEEQKTQLTFYLSSGDKRIINAIKKTLKWEYK